MLIRSQGADYGFELNEFDPFFNYRATDFIINNGLDAYLIGTMIEVGIHMGAIYLKLLK